jgi:hypothetical protein
VTQVDGNYLKMQGEALARMQVSYQAESQAQQVRAQVAGDEALRRLREEVEQLDPSDGQDRGPLGVGPRDEKPPGSGSRSGAFSRGKTAEKVSVAAIPPDAEGRGSRIDVRA